MPARFKNRFVSSSFSLSSIIILFWSCVAGCALLDASAKKNPRANDGSPKPMEEFSAYGYKTPDIVRPERRPHAVLFKNATIMTAAGRTIPDGSLLMSGGRIRAISAGDISAPPGTTVMDLRGKYITPGIIDTHSHLGVYPTPYVRAHSDGNEMTSPNTSDIDALDAVWPQDPGFERAVRGGVTTVQILPGSANLIGGRSATLKLHRAVSSAAMRFPGAPTGLKMACGENPKRVYGRRGRRPSTRMGNMAAWRSYFEKARAHRQKIHKYNRAVRAWNKKRTGKKPKSPARKPGLETLIAAMNGEILLHVHCYRADEMIRVLELGRQFGFKVRSFHHAVEAYKIRDVLARKQVSVSTWVDWYGFKIEAQDALPQNAALIASAGGRAIIHSDDVLDIQRLNQKAAMGYHHGLRAGLKLTEDQALRWITLNPAWALGIDKETGSLETGKMADLVVWSRHPFSIYAKAEQVYIDGIPMLRQKEGYGSEIKPRSDFEVNKLPKAQGLNQ